MSSGRERFPPQQVELGAMNGKLSVGETLSEVFSLYGDNFGLLMPVAFWIFLVVAIVDGVTASNNIYLLALSLAIGTIAGTLYQGVVVSLVRNVHGGRTDSSIRELIDAALPRVMPLIGAGLISGVAIAFGFILFLVPGLYLATIWAVIAPVIVVEDSGVGDAFGRSRTLVRGNGWPVLGAVFVGGLIVVVGGLILTAIAAAIADGPILRIVFSAIAATVTAPISALVAAVLYFRLRALEGVAPAPPVPPGGFTPPPD